MEPPKLSNEQRRAATRKATAVRRTRAEFKARLASGTLTPLEGLDEALADDVLSQIRITAFLKSLPRWGTTRTEEFVRANGLTADRRLRGLGKKQLTTVRTAISSRDSRRA